MLPSKVVCLAFDILIFMKVSVSDVLDKTINVVSFSSSDSRNRMKNKSFWVGTKALFTIKSILRIFYFWSKDSIAMEILTLQRLRAKTKKVK